MGLESLLRAFSFIHIVSSAVFSLVHTHCPEQLVRREVRLLLWVKFALNLFVCFLAETHTGRTRYVFQSMFPEFCAP